MNNLRSGLLLLAITLVTGLCYTNAYARTAILDCDQFTDPNLQAMKLGRAIQRLNRYDTLQLRGTCYVNLLIPATVNDITLDGQGMAIINGPAPSRDVVRIEGRGIILKGLDITGGRDGVHIHWGGQSHQRGLAGLESNRIHHTGRHGIVVHGNSSMRMLANTVQNNPGWGIYIHENSSARIGDLQYGGGSGGVKNVIEYNGSGGIQVERSSSAHIARNNIQNNAGRGIYVHRGSHAYTVNNKIRNNDQDGVYIGGASAMRVQGNEISGNLGSGVKLNKNAQSTLSGNSSVAPNASYAVNCGIGSVVDGNVSSLSGNNGVFTSDIGCVEGLADYP